MDDAGRAMFNGAYANKLIEVGVADGQLTIGFEKKEADYRDWLIVGRFYLSYMSKDVKGENLKPLQDELSKLIETATALPQTPGLINAIAEANKQLSEAKSSTALLAAIDAIQGAVNGVQQIENAINYFMATKAITDAKGIDTAAASELFNTAISRDDYNNALKQIRLPTAVMPQSAMRMCSKAMRPQKVSSTYITSVRNSSCRVVPTGVLMHRWVCRACC